MIIKTGEIRRAVVEQNFLAIMALIELNIAAERERCAKIVEDQVRIADGMWDIAAAIRKGT